MGLGTVDVPQGRSALSCSRSIGDGEASSEPTALDALAEVSEGDANGVSRRRKLDEVLPKCVHPDLLGVFRDNWLSRGHRQWMRIHGRQSADRYALYCDIR